MAYQLGIIGGIGSEASSYLYEKILKQTAVKNDQDHIDMIILNHASIADRTSFILDNKKDNPLPAFLSDIELLNSLHVELIVIPCNTSHYFYDDFSKVSKAPIYHMIEQAILHLKHEDIHKVGILATDGTIQSQLYQQICDKYNVAWEIPNPQNQSSVMELIYNYIKIGKDINKTIFDEILKEMKEKKVDRIILACTELSMLKEKEDLSSFFCDPLDIATDFVLSTFHKNKKR